MMNYTDGWTWKDESAVDFFKWANNEPNGQGFEEDCVEMYPWDGYWNDISCYDNKGFICKASRSMSLGLQPNW